MARDNSEPEHGFNLDAQMLDDYEKPSLLELYLTSAYRTGQIPYGIESQSSSYAPFKNEDSSLQRGNSSSFNSSQVDGPFYSTGEVEIHSSGFDATEGRRGQKLHNFMNASTTSSSFPQVKSLQDSRQRQPEFSGNQNSIDSIPADLPPVTLNKSKANMTNSQQHNFAPYSTPNTSQSLYNLLSQEQFQQLMTRFDHQTVLTQGTSMNDDQQRHASTSILTNQNMTSSSSQSNELWNWLSTHNHQQSLIPSHFQWPNPNQNIIDATPSPRPSEKYAPEITFVNKRKVKAPLRKKSNIAGEKNVSLPTDAGEYRGKFVARRRSDGDSSKIKLVSPSISSNGKDTISSTKEENLNGKRRGESDYDGDDGHDKRNEINVADGEAKDDSKVYKILIPCRTLSDSDAPQFKLRHVCPHEGCAKNFSTSGHARRHSRIHSTFRQYGCPHPGCPAVFTRKDNCKQHQKNSHAQLLEAVKFKKGQ